MERFVRFKHCGQVGYGRIEDREISVLDRNFLDSGAVPTGETLKPEEVELLAPVDAPNVICIGLNYKPHAAEAEMKLPEIPLIFLKTTTALAGPGEKILLPRIAPDNVDYEGELAIIIGRRAKNVPVEDAMDCVFGYTIANDVSARDCQLHIDGQWARGKSFDTFCPMGPAAVRGIDGDNLHIQTRLNGRVMQDSSTSNLIFNVAALVSFCSRNMTLLPGTVILTGTPEGVGFSRVPPVWLREGDRVEIEIENIGVLVNDVALE